MKIITIKISIPKKETNWKVLIGKGRPLLKSTAVGVYRYIERYLLTNSTSYVDTHFILLLDFDALPKKSLFQAANSGLYTQKKDMLYGLINFLEEYLPYRYKKIKEHKYEK